MAYSTQKAPGTSPLKILLPQHRFRARYVTAFCVFLFVLVLAAVFVFQLSAMRASDWSFHLHNTPQPSKIETKVIDDCYLTNNSILSNTHVLDSTAENAYSCARKKVLSNLKKELDNLPDLVLQKLAEKTEILDPKLLGNYSLKYDETKIQLLQRKFDDLQKKINSLINFLPVRDVNFSRPAEEAQSFFMSGFDLGMQDENGLLYFPSQASNGKILCVKGNDTAPGSTKNSYALAWKDYLPPNFTLLKGMTYVTRQYEYFNIYHALIALSPFLYWHKHHEFDKPERLVLYGSGEIKTEMGPWVTDLVRAGIGYKVPIETLQAYGGRPVCFEKSVVNRHGYSRFTDKGGRELFDLVRDKSRQFCNLSKLEKPENVTAFNVTLLTREGNRSFKNESVVASILKKECDKVPGCRFRIVRADDLTFCGQVQALSSTQVLISVHGAQNTNMVFMNRGSRVMEMFPRGWKQFGGFGQFVYHWLADYSGMKHEGDWHDNDDGAECPIPEKDQFRCFMFFKNQRVGYNETSISLWVGNVLKRVGASAPTA